MISFENDYSEGCCPEILAAFAETNYCQERGYGNDRFCKSAEQKIREACKAPEAHVFFLNGGTQTNQFVIDSTLQSYEGVIAATTGHINFHEAGSIEYTGHKVLTIPGHEGKIAASDLQEYLDVFYGDDNRAHMICPGMVYISHPTEYGTLYSLSELKAISEICRKYRLPLFLDGARLGYGLAAKGTDVTLPDISRLCDVFYIGGTKVGALCGEAVVYTSDNVPAGMTAQIKQHGALSAKGRLYGVQFDTLFTDGLYYRLSQHAIDMAEKLKEIFLEKNLRFFLDSPTNQQFVILENSVYAELSKEVVVSFWEKYDDTHTVVRFATSWATKEENVDRLREILNRIM